VSESQIIEEEEAVSSEEEEEYNPDRDELDADGSTESESEQDLSDIENEKSAEKEIAILKKKLKAKKDGRKRKMEKKSSVGPVKKTKLDEGASTSTAASQAPVVDEGEKSFDTEKLTGKKGGKKEAPTFNDKNVDYNLFSNDPGNVVSRKIKIASNVILTCKMIESDTKGGLSYDYAALTFQRKTRDEKAFEFNLPLTISPNLIQGLKLIMQDNPKFFSEKS
jgi:hypothetical protein